MFQVIYFLIFIGICIPIIISIVQEEIAANPHAGWIHLARESASEFAPVGVGAAIGSLIAVQGVALIVSLYHIITNWFTLPAIERHREEGREQGLEQGRTEGREEGREEGRAEGRTEGRTEGREEGREEGRAEGVEESNQAWRVWLRDREEAEAEGRPFDEPPPDQRAS